MSIQDLLNKEARLSGEIIAIRKQIREERDKLFTKPPACFGSDDCTSLALVVCPWRFDCGEND